jgi:hypothetical protein
LDEYFVPGWDRELRASCVDGFRHLNEVLQANLHMREGVPSLASHFLLNMLVTWEVRNGVGLLLMALC